MKSMLIVTAILTSSLAGLTQSWQQTRAIMVLWETHKNDSVQIELCTKRNKELVGERDYISGQYETAMKLDSTGKIIRTLLNDNWQKEKARADKAEKVAKWTPWAALGGLIAGIIIGKI